MQPLLVFLCFVAAQFVQISAYSFLYEEHCLLSEDVCVQCSDGGAVTEQGTCPDQETCIEHQTLCLRCSSFSTLQDDGTCAISVQPREPCSQRDPLCFLCDNNDDFCLSCLTYAGLDMGGTCRACEQDLFSSGQKCLGCFFYETIESVSDDEIVTVSNCTNTAGVAPFIRRMCRPHDDNIGYSCFHCGQLYGCHVCYYNFGMFINEEDNTRRCEQRCVDPLCSECLYTDSNFRPGVYVNHCLKCVAGYGTDWDTRGCLPCDDPNCAVCSQLNKCTTCKSGYYTKPNIRPGLPGPWCVPCSTQYCTECDTSPDVCTECRSGFALVENDCIARPCKLAGCRLCDTDQERVCVECEQGYDLTGGRCEQEEPPQRMVCADEKCVSCHPLHPEVCYDCEHPAAYDYYSRMCYGPRCGPHCEDCYEDYGICAQCEPGYDLIRDSGDPHRMCYANESVSEMELVIQKLQRKIENLLEPMLEYLDQVEVLREWGAARNREEYDELQDLRTAAKRAGERDLAKQYYQLILADNSVRKTRAGIERVMNTQRRNMGRRRDKLQEKAALLMEWGM